MANLPHRVTRVLFDLDIAQANHLEPVRRKLSEFCGADLGAVLEACLTEFDRDDSVMLIDRVELDLGALSPDRLEDDLPRKIRDALRHYLAAKITRDWPRLGEAAAPSPPANPSDLERLRDLADYLTLGSLPVTSGGETRPDQLLAAAVDGAPEALIRLLRALGQKASIRQRLVQPLSEASLHRLIRLLAPDHVSFIIDLARDLAEWPGAESATNRALGGAVWEFVLAYLLMERGPAFSRRAFTESLTRQMAGRLALSHAELVDRLARAGWDWAELNSAVTPDVAPSGQPNRLEAISPARRRLQVLETFLTSGVMPWPKDIGPGLGINRVLESLMDEAPDELLYLLRRLGYRDSVRKRLVFEFSERVIERLIGLLEPGEAGLIIAYVRDVAETQARRPVVQQENRSFRKSLWEFVLTFLLCERGSRFNARSFVKSTLRQMAARYRIAYGELLLGLIVRSDLLRTVASQRYSLPAILLSLADEFHVGLSSPETPTAPPDDAAPASGDSGVQSRQTTPLPPHDIPALYASDVPSPIRQASQANDNLALVAHWLAKGQPPVWSRFTDTGGLRHLLAGLRRQRPLALAQLMADLARDPAVAARLAQQPDIVAALREFAGLPRDWPPPGLPVRRDGEDSAGWSEATSTATPTSADPLVRLLRYGLWPETVAEGTESAWLPWLDSLTDGEVLTALYRVGPLESAVQRMIWQLPAAFYDRVLRLLAGTDIGPVLTCRTALEALDGENTAFAGQVRAYLLAYLLSREQEPGPLDAQDLLRRVLSALATRYGKPYRRLVDALGKAVQDGELQPVVTALRREMQGDDVAVGLSPRRDAPPRVERGLNPAPTPPRPEYQDNTPPSPIARLLEFLNSGRLPRLASGAPPDAPQRWLAEALAANPDTVRGELLSIGARPDVIGRLLCYLPEADLSRLLQIMAPDYAGFALSYLRAGAGLADDASLSATQRSRARQAHWQTVLTLVLDAHAPSFAASQFLTDMSQRVAQRLGLPFPRYVEALRRHTLSKGEGEPRYAVLAKLLEDLRGAAPSAGPDTNLPEQPGLTGQSGPSDSVEAREETPPGPVEVKLREFLRYGVLPEDFEGDAAAQAFEQDIRRRPDEYRRLLLEALGRDLERQRLARWLPAAWFRQVLRLLLPDASETALTSLASLREAAARMPGNSPALWQAWGAYELLGEIRRRYEEAGQGPGGAEESEDIDAGQAVGRLARGDEGSSPAAMLNPSPALPLSGEGGKLPPIFTSPGEREDSAPAFPTPSDAALLVEGVLSPPDKGGWGVKDSPLGLVRDLKNALTKLLHSPPPGQGDAKEPPSHAEESGVDASSRDGKIPARHAASDPAAPDWDRYWLAVLRHLNREAQAEPELVYENLRAAIASGSGKHRESLLRSLDSVAREAMLAGGGPNLPPLSTPHGEREYLHVTTRDETSPSSPPWETAPDGTSDPVARLVGFLQTGSSPPPIAGIAGDTPRAWLDAALAEYPERLWGALQAAATRPAVIRRLLHYLPADSLFRLVAALSPEQAEFIRGYLLSGGALEMDGRLPVNQRKRAKQIHWQEVLTALLSRPVPDVSPSRFVMDMSSRVAEQLGLSVPVYLERVLESARDRAAVETRYTPVVKALTEALRLHPAAPRDVGGVPPERRADGSAVVPPAIPPAPPPPKAERKPDAKTEFSLPGIRPKSSSEPSPPVDRLNQADASPAPAWDEADWEGMPPDVGEADDVLLSIRRFLQYGGGAGGDEASVSGPISPNAANQEEASPVAPPATERLENWLDKPLPAEIPARELHERGAEYRRYFLWAAGREPERRRMVRGLAAGLFRQILRLLLPADAEAACLSLDVLREAAGRLPGATPDLWWQTAADELLWAAQRWPGRRLDWPGFWRAVLQRLHREQRVEVGAALDVLRPALERHTGSARERLLQALAGVPRDPKPPASPGRPSSRPQTASKSESERPPAWPYRSPDEADSGDLPTGESFYVENAGLVLLWPFLSRYFQMLELVEKNQFRDENARSRAAYLLQFLATGSMDAPEPALLLNKILCGAKTAEPLEPQLPPTEAEQQLSEQMLYGVTQNWSKLRNTSIPGFRESFLQREGRLQRSDEFWSLTVGTKAYDLLLDTLPWNISTIRLGWMEQPLFVKWR